MKISTLINLLIILLLAVSLCKSEDSEEKVSQKLKKKKSTKDWNRLDPENLEKEWRNGDATTELENEYEYNEKVQQKMAKKIPGVNPEDPESVKKYIDAMKNGGVETKPAMIFVELTATNHGVEWTKKDADILAGKWQALMRTGSTDAELYVIENNQMLLNVRKTWMIKAAMKFILLQPEVTKITRDHKDFYKKDFFDEDGDEL
jgi:hypothetical protein